MSPRRYRSHLRAASLAVCAVQLSVPDRSSVPNLEALRDLVLARLLEAAGGQPDLVVLPGLAGLLPALALAGSEAEGLTLRDLVGRYGCEAGEIWLDWCRTYARAFDVVLCGGSGFAQVAGALRHVAWLIGRDGTVLAVQAQTHVGPWERELGIEAGEELPLAEVGGVRVGLLVGADAFYPEAGRILALQGAQLLVCPQAAEGPYDAWRQRSGAWSQVQGNQVYAVEAYLVGRLGGRVLAGRTACLAPVELAPRADGVLAEAPDADGDASVRAVLDFARLRELRREYPIARHLNARLYLKYLPSLYFAAPAGAGSAARAGAGPEGGPPDAGKPAALAGGGASP